jgi:ATP-dependent Zn protease
MGYTMQRQTNNRFLLSPNDLENRMAIFTGGRAVEQLVFGEVCLSGFSMRMGRPLYAVFGCGRGSLQTPPAA